MSIFRCREDVGTQSASNRDVAFANHVNVPPGLTALTSRNTSKCTEVFRDSFVMLKPLPVPTFGGLISDRKGTRKSTGLCRSDPLDGRPVGLLGDLLLFPALRLAVAALQFVAHLVCDY